MGVKKVVGNRYWSSDEGMARLRSWKHMVGADVLVGERRVDKLQEIADSEYKARESRLMQGTHCWEPSCEFHVKGSGCERVADASAYCAGHACSDRSHYFRQRREQFLHKLMSYQSSESAAVPADGDVIGGDGSDRDQARFESGLAALVVVGLPEQLEAYGRLVKEFPQVDVVDCLYAVVKVPAFRSDLYRYVDVLYHARPEKLSATGQAEDRRGNVLFAKIVAGVLSNGVQDKGVHAAGVYGIFSPKAAVRLFKELHLSVGDIGSMFDYASREGVDPVPLMRTLSRAGYKDDALRHSLKSFSALQEQELWAAYKSR